MSPAIRQRWRAIPAYFWRPAITSKKSTWLISFRRPFILKALYGWRANSPSLLHYFVVIDLWVIFLAPMKAQPRAPLALAAAAFTCGILLSRYWPISTALWGWASASFVLCAVAAVAIESSRAAQFAAVLAMLCAGAFAGIATPSPRLAAPPSEFLNVKDVEIVGHVTNDGALLAGGGPRERFDLQTETLELDGQKFSQPVGIRATVFSRDVAEETQED